jgi:hypothetical protein
MVKGHPNLFGTPVVPTLEEPVPDFDGETYERELDYDRLGKQLRVVLQFMRDRGALTLRTISDGTGYPETSCQARFRDYRKPKFSKHLLAESWRDGTSGTWFYRVSSKD